MTLRNEGLPINPKEHLTSNSKAAEQVKGLFGDIDEHEWKNVQEAIGELKNQFDRMEWFSFGPNSVSATRVGQRWTELVLVPKDSEHQAQLEQVLEYLGIYPWPEMRGNVPALIIESPRDMHLLRESLMFDYLKERMKKEGRAKEMEEWVDPKKRIERKARMVKEAEKAEKMKEETAFLLRLERERGDFANKRQEREEKIIEFLKSLPISEDGFEPPVALARDHFYQFTFKPPQGTRPASRRERKAPEAVLPLQGEDTAELDIDLEEIVQTFDRGLINEDELDKDLLAQAHAHGNQSPNLSLFKRKYRMESPDGRKKKILQEIATGRFITPIEEQATVRTAHDGLQDDSTKEEREAAQKAFGELALMYRGLVLYMMREIVRRYGDADPDDLFDAGLRGMFRSLQRHEEARGAKYTSYLMPYMEGYMRRIAGEYRVRELHIPIHRQENRARIHEAREALRGQNPDKAVDEQEVARVLADQGIGGMHSIAAYERFARRAFMTYQKEGTEGLDTAGLSDVSMAGESLYAESDGHVRADQRELKELITRAFSTLSPREERVLRLRFEMDEERSTIAEDLYGAVRDEYLPGLSIPEVKARIHALTEHGDLTRAEVYQNLSLDEQKLAAGYVALLEKYTDFGEGISKGTLEDVGQQFSVTRERVRQMEAKALRKLKHPARSRVLRLFLDAEVDRYQSRSGEKKGGQVYDDGYRSERRTRNRSEKKSEGKV